MKTNFKNQGYLVLATGNDRIISIIKCNAGLQSIKKKVIQAILDDFNASKTTLLADTTIIENGVTTIFKARIYSGPASFEEYFKLINTAIY
jgi:hypothetical protein